MSELLTGDETLVYYFEPRRHINNKQWLSKNNIRPDIKKRKRSAKKISYVIFLNSSDAFVQIPCKDGIITTGKFIKRKKIHQNKLLSKGLKGIQLIHDNASHQKEKDNVYSFS